MMLLYSNYTCYIGAKQVLDQLEEMHGSLSGRLQAAQSRMQREIALDGHLDFVCGLKGSYGARYVHVVQDCTKCLGPDDPC